MSKCNTYLLYALHLKELRWGVGRECTIRKHGRIVKAKEFAEAKGLECYVPLQYKEVRKQGKKRIVEQPLLPSFLFIYAKRSQIDELLCNSSSNTTDKKALLSFYYDHTSYREDASDKNPPLTISDSAMDNFIRLTSIKNPHVIPVTSENIMYKLGDEVVITEGEFIGIHGRVARIAGQQRVVVELFDGCLVATAYVPKEATRKNNTQVVIATRLNMIR